MTEGDYAYTISGDNATITGYTGSGGTIIVPVILGNATVTSIGDSAFKGSAVTDIILPNSITSIDNYAFSGCNMLKNLTLPDSLTSMGYRIIENTMITSITIPKNVTSCSHYYYYNDRSNYAGPLSNCNTLTEVIFEEGIETIPSYVLSTGLYDTSFVTKVSIPASVTTIGERAFYNCEKIKDIELPEGLIKIGNYTFSSCSSLDSLILPESLTSIGYGMIENTAITSIIIPKNVTSCGHTYNYGPLSNCSTLIEVIFEDGLKTIPSCALSAGPYTNNIIKVIIPSSVTAIGEKAFYNCEKIKCIDLPARLTDIGDSAFGGCSSLSSLALPEEVSKIGDYVFSGCSSLNSLTLPKGVTKIGNYAFSNCSSLSSLTLSENLTKIGNRAFSGCSSLSNLTLPEGLTSMGYEMIEGTAIASIIIPQNVTNCGCYQRMSDGSTHSGPLANCSTLTEVIFEEGMETVPSCVLASSNCSSYVTNVVIPQSATSIGDNAFRDCSKITNIKFSTRLETIGSHAFKSCVGLNELNLPESLCTIHAGAFEDCTSLKEINLPKSLTTICGDSIYGSGAFERCTGLINVEFPIGLKTIGSRAFMDCIGLKEINLPKSLTIIGARAFSYTGITNVEFPETVTSIGEEAFYRCESLESVIFNYSKEHSIIVERYVFGYCTSLKKVEFSENVTSIGTLSFNGCSSLCSLILPEGLTVMGDRIIANTKITSITIPKSVTNCEYFSDNNIAGPLAGCGTLTEVIFEEGMQKIPSYILASGNYTCPVDRIVIPRSVTEIGSDAFSKCNSLTDIYYEGDEKQWKKIKIDYNNDVLKNATIHYNSTGPKDGFYFSATTPTTCIKVGETLEFDVQYYEKDEFDTSIEDVIYVVSDSNVMDVTPGNWDNTKGKHYIVKAKSAGYSTITFTNPNNGKADVIELYVVEGETGYSFESVPKFTVEKGKNTNFYNYSGMVVDEFKYIPLKDADGKIVNYNVTMTVYNTLNLYGAVTSYDKDGNLKGYYVIDRMKTQPTSFGDNIKSAVYHIGDLGHWLGNNKYYSGKGTSKETKVEIIVPVGGHLEISNSPLSEVVVLVNIVGGTIDNITAASGYITGAYDLSDCEAKIIQAVLRDVFSDEYLAKKITKCIKKAAIDELKKGNWNYDNFGDCVNAVLDQLTEFGVDLVGIIEKSILSFDSASSISESIIMKCIPTGKLINFMYDVLGTVDSLGIWDTFMQSVNFPRGIYIYAPSADNTLSSNGVKVTPTGESKSNTVIHAYLVLDTSEISGSKYQTYNINMYRDGQKIQPDAPVAVQIPIPSGYSKTNIKVYRLNDDGTITDMDATVADGYVSFTTEHFSYYALVSGDKGVFLTDWEFGDKSTVTLSALGERLKGSIVVYAASYNRDGKMLDIVSGDDFLYNGSELQVIFNHQLTKDWELFILDSATYAPLCPSIAFPSAKR